LATRPQQRTPMNIYVCAPWRDPNSYLIVNQICKKIIELGHNPVCWAIMYSSLLDFSDFKNREIAIKYGISLMDSCQEVWVFGSKTQIMQQEVTIANEKDIPIVEYSLLDFQAKTR
jgi:hypothetical protein